MPNMTPSKLRIATALKLFGAALLVATTLSGCALWPFGGEEEEEDIEAIDTSEQLLYRNSQRFLRSGNYATAIKNLELLEARFPFGRYAEQAQLELIFARHMSLDHDAARTAADRFIRLHPNHNNVDYAYYLKGLASFNKSANLFDRFVTTDPAKRDMTSVREAYAEFGQLIARFPNSEYGPDAQKRMVHLRNVLARSELHAADFYLRRGAYMAANNRAQYVLDNYPQSTSIPDALAIMAECGWRLGLEDNSNDALRVLASNYPNFPAFDDNGQLVLAERVRNRDRSWTNLVTLGLLDRPKAPPPLTLRHPEGYVPSPVMTAGNSDQSQPSSQSQRATKKKKGWFSWLPFVD